MKHFLYYITNNLDESVDEKKWDVIFWLVATILLAFAIPLLIWAKEYGWVFLGLLFYLEFWDQLRNNRDK